MPKIAPSLLDIYSESKSDCERVKRFLRSRRTAQNALTQGRTAFDPKNGCVSASECNGLFSVQIKLMFVDAAGNHHRLELYRMRLRNQAIGDAGTRLKLPQRLTGMRFALLQFQRRHPVAAITDQQKIAAALCSCWKKTVHVYQHIRKQIRINLRPAPIRCTFFYAASVCTFADLTANSTDKTDHGRTLVSR